MLFLANLLGCVVQSTRNDIIGTLADILVQIGPDPYPSISGLVVRDRRRLFFVPATQLVSFDDVIQLTSSVVNMHRFKRRDGEVLLSKDVLDHQIIDITGRRIVRVNDVQLALVEDSYRIVGVDISPQALIRRLAPHALRHRIVGRQVIAWEQVHYLASDAPVVLTTSYKGLSQLNPVDLARIVDAVSYRESADIVAALDDVTAAQILEEVSDERLMDLLENMDQERAADILEEMDPGAAADVLEDLGIAMSTQLLARMERDDAATVQMFLQYDEDSAGRIMTTEFVRIGVSATVGDVLTLLRSLAEIPDPLLAVYIVNDDAVSSVPPVLRGIVRLRSLLTSTLDVPITTLMDHDVPTVNTDERAEYVARIMAEYNLLAVPVLDDQRHMVGVVTVDDALAVMLPDIWQRRGPRMFG